MEILAQSSFDLALTYNFQDTHIYWAHREVIFAIAWLIQVYCIE